LTASLDGTVRLWNLHSKEGCCPVGTGRELLGLWMLAMLCQIVVVKMVGTMNIRILVATKTRTSIFFVPKQECGFLNDMNIQNSLLYWKS